MNCIIITWDLVQKCRILDPTLDLDLLNQNCSGEMVLKLKCAEEAPGI